MVNWLHACYGIGATGGPLLMTWVLAAGRPWQQGYWIVGVWQLLLAACFSLTLRWWPDAKTPQETPAPSSMRAASTSSALRRLVVWLSIAVFFIYTGIEAAAGTWAYSLFTMARAVPAGTAGLWVSIYWGSFTAGRLISGLIASHTSVPRLLRLCIIGMAAGAAMIWLDLAHLLSFLGLALMGLSSAPIFPSLIAATPTRLGPAHTAHGVGFQIAAAVLGQSLLPSLVGVLAGQWGLEVVGPALLAAAILLLALHEALIATSSKVVRESRAMA
jgi:fucose permease